MNPNIAIIAENISKQYRLGEVGTGTITHDLNRAWAKLRGKEDPFLKIGESNDRSSKAESDYVWSLKDINFEIEKGDAVGIIGRNGAGKSTLLKLLSRVTKPTTGHFEVQGRIASLLEVGTGFNPEMTGRENIFLNGAILGMRRQEIKRKFDEIVDFAGVERYIDTPVKRYSSGMYVRLAFAVAAHLESEILIVDEVLAVGDAEFQKKCLGKMGDVSRGEGRTVLFVSHNMASVQKLCAKGILLENGRIVCNSNISTVLNQYLQTSNFEITPNSYKNIFLNNFKSYSKHASKKVLISGLDAVMEFEILSTIKKENVEIGIGINDLHGNRLITPFSKHVNKNFNISKGTNLITCMIERFPLKPGSFSVEIYIGCDGEILDYYDKGLNIDVEVIGNTDILQVPDSSQGNFIINQIWNYE